MFTGIITAIGKVNSIQKNRETIQLNIDMANLDTSYLNIGDSIAVNGVCLTATKLEHNSFIADVMPATFKATNLKNLRLGSKVNLERALSVNGRLNGHILTGHVDDVIKIINKYQQQNAINYFFTLPNKLQPYVVPKGCVALDGTSLTITEVKSNGFGIAMIPHSVKHTVLGSKGVGDEVNLEVDLLAKYVLKSTNINQNFLSKYDF